jgi:hypothetical protein
MSSEPSEGVFFVLRLPKGWQLCTCRHDEYGPLGLPDFWVEALGSFLNIWLSHFLEKDREHASSRHTALERALGMVVAGFDAFPRGEVQLGGERNQYVVRHGGEMNRALKVSRREVEDAFGIQGRAKWVEEERLASAPESAERLRKLLPIKEHWEGRKTAPVARAPRKRPKRGGRRPKTGGKRPERGGRRPKSGGRKPKSGGGRPKKRRGSRSLPSRY